MADPALLAKLIVAGAPERTRGLLTAGNLTMVCALGRAGVVADKREGDGGTPVGRFALRRVLYRPDRGDPPRTGLPVEAIAPNRGWCDDPDHAAYNRPVALPFAGRCERLWRDDALYDLLVVLGHNDDPPRPGSGSAIFLHIRDPDWRPTEGCVAVTRRELEALLSACGPDSAIDIRLAPARSRACGGAVSHAARKSPSRRAPASRPSARRSRNPRSCPY